MVNIKETLKEVKAILTELKTHADNNTALSGNDKTRLETRLKHLQDKNQDHSQSPAKLDIDLTDLDNLDTLIGQDKTQWATEKSKLEKDKKDAEDEKNKKASELLAEVDKHNKTKTEVADKLNADLITGLNTLINTGLKKPKKNADGTDEKDSSGNIIYEDIFDKTQIDAIKKVVEEIKTKGAKVDVSSLDSKFKEVKDEVGKLSGGEKGINYWSIGACIGAGLAAICGIYVAFFKKNEVNVYEGTKKEEIDIS